MTNRDHELVNPAANDGVTWGDIFNTQRQLRDTTNRAAAMNDRARQRAGLLNPDEVPARQRNEGQQRAAEVREQPEEPAAPAFSLDWHNATHWLTPAGYYPIDQMEMQHLWETVIWCVRSVDTLHAAYDRISTDRSLLTAKNWLRMQPVFRAMVQESLRRQVTFPKDVVQYIREYMLRRQDPIANFEPWNDPAARRLQSDLDEFLSEPVTPDDNYKERRSIDLG